MCGGKYLSPFGARSSWRSARLMRRLLWALSLWKSVSSKGYLVLHFLVVVAVLCSCWQLHCVKCTPPTQVQCWSAVSCSWGQEGCGGFFQPKFWCRWPGVQCSRTNDICNKWGALNWSATNWSSNDNVASRGSREANLVWSQEPWFSICCCGQCSHGPDRGQLPRRPRIHCIYSLIAYLGNIRI